MNDHEGEECHFELEVEEEEEEAGADFSLTSRHEDDDDGDNDYYYNEGEGGNSTDPQYHKRHRQQEDGNEIPSNEKLLVRFRILHVFCSSANILLLTALLLED